MLDSQTSYKSTAVVYDVHEELTKESTYLKFTGIVTAKINGNVKIDQDEIIVVILKSIPNYATIHVMWEDCGYKHYKDMGLFGEMTTEWQKVEKTGNRTFTIFSETYEVAITY